MKKLIFLVALLAVLLIAPVFSQDKPKRSFNENILIYDASDSMLEEKETLWQKWIEILRPATRSIYDEISIIAVGHEATIVFHGTGRDLRRAEDIFKKLKNDSIPGTNIARALNMAAYLFNTGDNPTGKNLIVFSDMYNDRGQCKNYLDSSKVDFAKLTGVNIKIYFIPMESQQYWQPLFANCGINVQLFDPEQSKYITVPYPHRTLQNQSTSSNSGWLIVGFFIIMFALCFIFIAIPIIIFVLKQRRAVKAVTIKE